MKLALQLSSDCESQFKGQPLMKLIWRVGDSRDVRVFLDAWVPTLQDFRVSFKDGCSMQMRV